MNDILDDILSRGNITMHDIIASVVPRPLYATDKQITLLNNAIHPFQDHHSYRVDFNINHNTSVQC